MATPAQKVATAPGELFNPLSVPGCVMWLRADLGVQSLTGSLTSWTDQASGAVFNTPPVGATFPGVSQSGGPNNLAALTFAGTSSPQSLVNLGFNPLTSGVGTMFVVMKSGVAAQNPAYICCMGSSNSLIALCLGSRDMRTIGGDFVNGLVTSNWELWTLQSVYGKQRVRWNGGNEVFTSTTFTEAVQSGGTAIGDATSHQHPFNGLISEVFVYNRELTLQEIIALETYVRLRTSIW